MDIETLTFGLVAIATILLVLALVLQPVAQKRREREIWQRMKDARDAAEAQAVIDNAIESNRDNARLPDNWNDSYRFRGK